MTSAFQKFDPYSFLLPAHDVHDRVAKPAKSRAPKFSNISEISRGALLEAEVVRPQQEERAAIIQTNGVPREWAEGYAALCTMPRPVAYTPERWQQIVDDGGYFLDQWGRQVAELGWRAVDVFGVNPDAPEGRYDGMGLVPLLAGRRVCLITADTARIECGHGLENTFYRRNMGTEAAAIWSL